MSTRAAALPAEERRITIVEATIPLLVEHGGAVTTRQIAEAAGIAEGTIFRVFEDKDAVIAAAVDRVLDPAPLEDELAMVDADLPLEARLVQVVEILQERVVNVWRLLSAIGPRHVPESGRPIADSDRLIQLLEQDARCLQLDPRTASRVLRSMAVALTHPSLIAEPLDAPAIVDHFLHGACRGGRPC